MGALLTSAAFWVGFAAGGAAYLLASALRRRLSPWLRHRRSRSLPAQAGQVWIGRSRDAFTVHKLLPDDRILVHSFREGVLSLTRDEWRETIDHERLGLIANFREAA